MRLAVFCVFLLIVFQSFSQENLKVVKIQFSGNDSISEEALLSIMNTKTLTLIEKIEFWKENAIFSSYTLKEDLARLKKHYQQNGFLDPVITAELIPNKKNRKLKIEILISQGKTIVNGEVNYSLANASLPRKITFPEKILTPLKSGARFRDEDVIITEKKINEYYSNSGYPYNTVSHELVLNEKLGKAQINFNITPGTKAYFGEVKLKGDSLIPRSFINKHIEIIEGAEYSQKTLDQTQEDLFDMGLFKYLTIRAILDSVENSRIPVLIQIKEMPRWSFRLGLGYGTEDKVRTSLMLSRLNFLGGGRTFILKGQHSYYVPLSVDVKFIQPDLGFKDLDLILNPFLIREREDSYVVDRLGTSLSLQKKISKKTSAYISYNLGIDRVDLSNSVGIIAAEIPDTSNNIKSGITIGFNRNTSDNLFYPSKGWKYNIIASYMGIGFNSKFHYYKLISEVDRFMPVAKNIVFACKLKGGIMAPIQGNLLTPIEDRFLQGGALSLRGWGRNKISPVNAAGDKIGGNTMIESSLELRFPIYGILSGTTFLDVGNVWESPWRMSLTDLRADFGVGLRLKSPIGPIRLDLATPISENKLSAQFFITVGHAF